MNKKGLLQRKIVMIIILLASALIIAIAIMKSGLFTESSDIIDKKTCRTAVMTRGNLWISVGAEGLAFDKQVPLECKTFHICVYVKDKKCPGLGERSEVQYIKVKNKDEVLKVFADKLTDSYWEFGEGSYRWSLQEGEGRFCFVTYKISFSEELNQEKIPREYLLEFLNKNEPFDGNSEWKNYADYFYNSGESSEFIFVRNSHPDTRLQELGDIIHPTYKTIDLSETYLIVIPQQVSNVIAAFHHKKTHVLSGLPRIIIYGQTDPFPISDKDLGCQTYFEF